MAYSAWGQQGQRRTMDGAALPIMKQSSACHCAGQCPTGRCAQGAVPFRVPHALKEVPHRAAPYRAASHFFERRLTPFLRCHLPEVQRSTVTGARGQLAPSSQQVPPAAPAAWTVPQPWLCPEQSCGRRNCLRTYLAVIGADSSADLGLGPEGRQGGVGGSLCMQGMLCNVPTQPACKKQCSNSTLW